MTYLFDPSLLPFMVFSLLLGYLSGSVPYGLILTKLAGHGDIRKTGSGNIGATNVLRVGGKKLAAITLLLDGLKAVVPVLLAKQIDMDYAVAAAFGAFIGHVFPVWLKFKGGKGVATALGVSFAFAWPLGLSLCIIWFLMATLFRYSSLAALTAFAMAPFLSLFFTQNLPAAGVMLFISVMIWIRHSANIKRLLQKTEPKIGADKK